MRINVHYNQQIPWQRTKVFEFGRGLRQIGLDPFLTGSLRRLDPGPAILLGTTFFKEIEADEYPSMLVDRASFDDPNQVQLVWDGRLRRGDHRVPEDWASRPRNEHQHMVFGQFREGDRVVLCGQENANGADLTLDEWYKKRAPAATHYKPHPAMINKRGHYIPGKHLQVADDFRDCGTALTLNSSVGVQCLINGIDVVADDPGAMLYPYSQGDMLPEENLQWIAWTQWRWDEIAAGEPIRHHFFDGKDYRFTRD